jgi:branched-chain amino acid aminotransferase
VGEYLSWINGRLVPASEATVPATDRGLLLGDGLFETMRSRNGRITNLPLHLSRLYRSAALLDLTIPFAPEYLADVINQTLSANSLPEAYVRLSVTAGVSSGAIDARVPSSQVTVVLVKPYEPYPDNLYASGMKVVTVSIRRNTTSPLSRVKSLSYLDSVLARAEARKSGADEGLMLNSEGYVASGTVSNVFFVRGNLLVTPALETGILPGTTRAVVLEAAQRLGLAVQERLVSVAELSGMEGAFLTNTLMGVMPVALLDGEPFAVAEVHPAVRRVAAEYDATMAAR